MLTRKKCTTSHKTGGNGSDAPPGSRYKYFPRQQREIVKVSWLCSSFREHTKVITGVFIVQEPWKLKLSLCSWSWCSNLVKQGYVFHSWCSNLVAVIKLIQHHVKTPTSTRVLSNIWTLSCSEVAVNTSLGFHVKYSYRLASIWIVTKRAYTSSRACTGGLRITLLACAGMFSVYT